ncbi:MAG: hypothetical protein LIO85_10375 [Rikenellaceae bacterium]|nr:hypothetical protein [Rikenellaceae bacterium]
MGSPKALPEEISPNLSFNPFSGYLEVESYWYSLDDETWELGNKFYPGTRFWLFADVEEMCDPDGNPAFTGNLFGYESVRVNYRIEFTWYPALGVIYFDHNVDSPFGLTDVYNETFRVGFAPNGMVELSYYENGIPEDKWVLIYRKK